MQKKISTISYFLVGVILLTYTYANGALISKNAVIKAHSSTSEWTPSDTKLAAKALFTESQDEIGSMYQDLDILPFGFHTEFEENPWIVVDLRKIKSIGSIKLVNRIDCCQERLVNLQIFVSNNAKKWTKVKINVPNGFDEWTGKINKKARFIKLMLDTEGEELPFHLTKLLVYSP